MTNLAVVVVLGIVANLLGVNRYLTANGLDLGALLGFALVMGFGGAIISLLIDKPLLMIAGSKADSLYMSEDAFAKATGTKDKELFKIDGATHIESYWVPKYVNQAVEKLTQFYGKSL